MRKRVLILIIAVLLIPMSINAETSCNNENARINAVKTVANAFYYRGGSLQYDDYSMFFNSNSNKLVRKRRSDSIKSPEDATMQDIKYSVCSEFVANVYYEAFSKNGSGYTFKYGDGTELGLVESGKFVNMANRNKTNYYNSNIAVYYANLETNTFDVNVAGLAINASNYRDVFANVLQPGDVISYRYKSWGHVVLYLGDDLVINATSTSRNKESYNGDYTGTGGSYNYQNKTDNLDPWGTVGYVSLQQDVLNYKDKYSKYVFEDGTHNTGSSDPKVIEISIIRPLNELTNDNITTKTCARMQHDKLVRTKTASVEKYETIKIGDTITYTITLENRSTNENYDNLLVTDSIPANTKFISFEGDGEARLQNDDISWTISVPANSKKTVSYTVQAINKGTIINNNTVVDGVKLNSIETLVTNRLSDEDVSKIKKLSNDNNKSYANMKDLLKDIYPKIDIPDANEVFNKIFAKHENEEDYFNKYGYHFTVDVTGNTTYGHTFETGSKKLFILKNKNDIDENYRDMYVSGLFGGVFAKTQNDTGDNNVLDDKRNKTWTNNSFMIGDIIYVNDDDYQSDTYMHTNSENSSYLYIDNNSLVTVQGGKLVVLSLEESKKVIDSLIGQNAFVVLRPSNTMKDNSNTIVSEVVSNIPDTGVTILNIILFGITIIMIGTMIILREVNKKPVRD